ncbi:MAG TPA: RNA 2',3'-cyclic phosphodiesterase [Thermoplasmataceae archaeon]|nr:RNA 2',3'-cyclic phosphodiesterase [Thermoplasmatales archaeon AK]HLH86565.1 RNA 2',3'-cyclic phosphodiesterase [Thermoplasmataceae archaeon]
MRAFIAIEVERFPEMKELEGFLRTLDKTTVVRTEKLHLTMFFLGNISQLAAEEICRKLSQFEFHQTDLAISGVGAFPNELAANVLFLNVKENESLRSAYNIIREMPSIKVLLRQKNHFVPHITVARFKSPRNARPMIERFAGVSSVQPVSSIKLFKSTLTDKGPVYEEVCRSRTS